MDSAVISIPEGEGVTPREKKSKFSFMPSTSFLKGRKIQFDNKKLIHSFKVGIALVSVSLLYLLDPLYKRVGDNAMWAVMTVVVIFEFYAGATLSKGLNRGLGTILGGGLGCLAAIIAQEVGGVGNAIIVAFSVFIFGAAATYARLIPKIKQRYDYGALIFILTFSLLVVSGLRAETVLILARDRLSTILMGFIICIFSNLVIFPIWAGDELHNSTISKFNVLASSIEDFLEAYLNSKSDTKNEPNADFSGCKSVLYSKSKDESLVNFARWEPWHGKFGYSYPWAKYLQIGEAQRELATTILSLKTCLKSSIQPSTSMKQLIKDPCEAIGLSLARNLRDLGDSIAKMKRIKREDLKIQKLQSIRQELSITVSPSKPGIQGIGEEVAIASFLYLLIDMAENVEAIAEEVEELGELAGFFSK